MAEFADSLSPRRIVFLAFVAQILAGLIDIFNAGLGLAVPAASPIGSGIMGVLLAIAITRSRVEADKIRFQLAGEKAALLECVPQPLFYFGNDYKIQWANNSAADFSGKALDELVGSPSNEIWGDEYQGVLPVELALETGKSAKREIVRQDGTTWVVYASPVISNKGDTNGAIELAMDITEIRQAQEALREFNTKILMAREEERRSVAQDLHDSVAQGLTSLQMHLHAHAEEIGTDSSEGGKFDKASLKCGQIGTEVRQISHQLYPPSLDLLGLATSLEEIFEPYQATGLGCSIECEDDLRKERFAQDVEVAFYRTAQEAISNAVRHGKAQKVKIKLGKTDDEVFLEVTDNGIGFDVEKNHKGLGMTSMTSRVEGIGGKLEVTSRPGQTSIRAAMPLERACNLEAEPVGT